MIAPSTAIEANRVHDFYYVKDCCGYSCFFSVID